LKKLLLVLLKIGLSALLVGWLVARAYRDEAFSVLSQRYYHPGFAWELLAGAAVLAVAGVLVTFLRWRMLVRALDIPFSLRAAIRLGFLGYLFNLAPLGIVGGDLLKAVLLVRQSPGRRAAAVATVLVDRIIGLYMLFLVAAVAILLTGFWHHSNSHVRYIAHATLALTAAATAGLMVLFARGETPSALSTILRRIPFVGAQVERLVEAVRLYRHKAAVLTLAALMSIAVHGFWTLTIYLLTLGIYSGETRDLSLAGEFVVVPLSESVGVIPLVMGPMEVVLDFLYANVFALDKRQGFVVCLGYRLITLLVATVGMCYYLGARQELATAIHANARPPAG
jgi:uncharacterized protein (TIRG00374 family)